jgi:GDP/UDP-N,N'-diacetylbacillosamine 2-epimerase (hydrolysing)
MHNKLTVVCTARPSWSKLRPVVAECVSQGIFVTLYAVGGTLLHRFGGVSAQMEREFGPVRRIYSEFDGYTLETAAKSTGALLQSLADAFSWDRPDLVLVNHDRREVLAVAQAAAYQNIPVAHIGGGEHSGNIDDRVRDAITCLSDWHFPATLQAAQRVMSLTESHAHIPAYGCPSVDLAREAQQEPPVTCEELGGVGLDIDLSQPFLTVLQHSETDAPDRAFNHMSATLEAARLSGLPALVFWPGDDAGADGAAKAIRMCQDEFHTVRTLQPLRFLRLLSQTACLVGNSSAGIRESTYLGTPVVNVGIRQQNRERGPNVVTVPHNVEAIQSAIRSKVGARRVYSSLYGDGTASARIVRDLKRILSGEHIYMPKEHA